MSESVIDVVRLINHQEFSRLFGYEIGLFQSSEYLNLLITLINFMLFISRRRTKVMLMTCTYVKVVITERLQSTYFISQCVCIN